MYFVNPVFFCTTISPGNYITRRTCAPDIFLVRCLIIFRQLLDVPTFRFRKVRHLLSLISSRRAAQRLARDIVRVDLSLIFPAMPALKGFFLRADSSIERDATPNNRWDDGCKVGHRGGCWRANVERGNWIRSEFRGVKPYEGRRHASKQLQAVESTPRNLIRGSPISRGSI